MDRQDSRRSVSLFASALGLLGRKENLVGFYYVANRFRFYPRSDDSSPRSQLELVASEVQSQLPRTDSSSADEFS